MKLKLILLPALSALCITAGAQVQTAKQIDAPKETVKIKSTNPDEGKHGSVYVGAYGPEGVNFVGASYYKPKAIYLNAMAGPTGGMIDGSFLFRSKMKERRLKQTARSGAIIASVIDAPMQQRKSVGLHAGASYVDYSSLKSDKANSFSTNGIFAGVTFLSSRHADWSNSDSKETQATTIGRINADVIYYISRQATAVQQGKEQPAIDQLSRKIGFRIYLDGKTSVWSGSGRIAIHYMAGVGRNSDKSGNIAPFGGIGIGYNFL